MHKYIEICNLFEKVESLQSRTEMSLEISEFFKHCNGYEIPIISYMIQGRVAPMFVRSEFNYSEKSLLKLLSLYTSQDVQKIRKNVGDIGDTIFEISKTNSNAGGELNIEQIYEILWSIINTTGSGSIVKKNNIVLECLKKLSPIESKYFVRTICGELRLGLSSKTLLEVFSYTVVGDKSLKDSLEHAYGVCADIGYIGRRVIESKGKDINEIQVIPGIPILSRLVQRVGSFDELKERFKDEVIVQPKFDGLRCQIHKWEIQNEESERDIRIWNKYLKRNREGEVSLFKQDSNERFEVRLFTRNLEDVTEMFPEIAEYAMNLKSSSFIMDSEIVGWNYKKGKFLSYQETMQRRRKYKVKQKMIDIPVRAFVFDLLYYEGKSLVVTNTSDRINELQNILCDTGGGIALAESRKVSSIEEISIYFKKSVNEGLEGIIVKQLKGGYRPGVRNYEWIKIKKSIEKELVDTIDMVVVGYYLGSGRRATFGVGAILGAIYNKEIDQYDAICKVGTGMSDNILKELNTKLSQIKTSTKPKGVRVITNLYPDVWVTPKYTISVDADEITKNISKDGENIGGGLSLRFPRLVEFNRDKSVEDITTVKEILNMYEMKK